MSEGQYQPSTQCGKVVGVQNQGHATFNYDNTMMIVQGAGGSSNMSTESTEPSSSSLSKSMSVMSNSKNLHNKTTAIQTEGGGTTTVNNPTINIGVESTSESKENGIKRILKTLHKYTWSKSSSRIGETFKRDKFPEPSFEVHPQMAESHCFYQGGHQVTVCKSANRKGRKLEMLKEAEYKNDSKFTLEGGYHTVPGSISLESLMKKICARKDQLGVLGIVAQAGAGKTTCMRRWARRTMEESGMTINDGFVPYTDARFELILFIEVKCIGFSEDTSVGELLFRNILEDDDDVKVANKWLLENQTKAAIFFDGLDQALWEITEDNLTCYEKASTPVIFSRLLTRASLPGARIIISSREHSATSLPEVTWFDEVITLTGFTTEDAKKLFNAITTDDDECEHACSDQATIAASTDSTENLSNWDKLVKTSSALLLFISIPAFLMFTAIVYKTYGSAPSSITDLMAKVIETLQYSLNIQERKKIWSIVHKLKELSHKGLENGLIIFSEQDLTNCGLELKDVRDLLLMVPRSRSLSHHLIEGDNVFFFSHQILQEFLSACYIVEMRVGNFFKKGFKDFVRTKLKMNHWSVVQRFVCGLSFMESPNEKLLQISDKTKKQQILSESLIRQLEEHKDRPSLELYASIYETNDDKLIQSISTIKPRDLLTHDEVPLIGLLLARSRELDHFTLTYSVMARYLPVLTEQLKDTKVRIKVVEVMNIFKEAKVSNLNKFLQVVDSDEVVINQGIQLDGKLDWKNIKRLKIKINEPNYIVIDNQSDDDNMSVLISTGFSENYFGTFCKKDAAMVVEPSTIDTCVVAVMTTVASILRASSVAYKGEEQLPEQHLDCDNFSIFPTCEVTGCKVKEIKLDCYHDLNEISEDIIPFFRQIKVKRVTLIISSDQINGILAELWHELGLLGCQRRLRLNAIVCSNVTFQELCKQLENHQIDLLSVFL